MTPPRLATRLLRRIAAPDDAEFLVNDLGEEFDVRARADGRRAAARWYWRQALTSIVPLAMVRLSGGSEGFTMSLGTMLRQNLRQTVRLLRGSPGLATVVVLTLALGVGANTAVFSVIDAVLLRPLPYLEPARLVSIWESTPQNPRLSVAAGDFSDLARQPTAFADLAAYTPASMALSASETPEQVWGEVVSWNLLALLGVRPAIGRPFGPEDDRAGSARVVIISDDLWRGRFGADPAILGRAIVLNAQPYAVVGVMPPGFRTVLGQIGTPVRSFLVPAALAPEAMASREHTLLVVGRLRPGATIEAARRDLDALSADLTRRFPERGVRMSAAPLGEDLVRTVRTSLVVMLGAVGLVVLIACVNVANLLIVWAMGQRRDVAIRLAIGASRLDVYADFLTRGLVLGALGGVAGLACGVWTRDLLVGLAPASIPGLTDLALNGRVLLVAAALSMVTGVVAGLVPAMQVLRPSVAPSLRATSLSASGAKSVMRWRGVLLTAEVAAAVVLALGAGLLVRSLMLLNRVELGFDTDRVLTMTLALPEARYPDARTRERFFEDVSSRVKTIPGVLSVAYANQFPMRGGWGGGLQVDASPEPIKLVADLQAVSPDYFDTLGITLERGRWFTAQDRTGSPPVAVVSHALVSRYAPGRDPIGLQIRRSPADPALTVIGVVGDIRRDGKFAEVTPQVYFASGQTQLYRSSLSALAVRTAGDPHALAGSIRRVVSAIDPVQPVTNVRTLEEILVASVATRRFNSWLLLSFALLALTLAVIGVYGVVTHVATERTREIGIRVALGATRQQVIALVVGSGLRWAVAGVALGLLAAYATARVMTSLLFETTPTDPLTFGVVTLAMLGVAAAASYVPARRAAAGNPLAALRAD